MIDALLELLDDRHVLPLVEAATLLGQPLVVLEECVKSHSGQFGVLIGRQIVVFQLTPEPVAEEQGADV